MTNVWACLNNLNFIDSLKFCASLFLFVLNVLFAFCGCCCRTQEREKKKEVKKEILDTRRFVNLLDFN